YLTSPDNRHALPLFTSLVNTVCSYDPVGLGLPYNHLLFADTLEPLVETLPDNLFINYLSRIHRDEDFQFILRGVTRLLNNPLAQTYLPNSAKKVNLHQEFVTISEDAVDGGVDQVAAPAGGVQYSLVPVLAASPSPSRVLPAGDVQ
ncbi:hypothetical protein HF086_002715, partial [Spodoptera exigua]